jgi:hypothetical protein
MPGHVDHDPQHLAAHLRANNIAVVYNRDSISIDSAERPNVDNTASTDQQLTITWPSTQKDPPPKAVHKGIHDFRGG